MEDLKSKYIYQQEEVVEPYEKGMFIEVAGEIRKRSKVPQPDGTFNEEYIKWDLGAIRRRYGNDKTKVIIEEMPNYDGEKVIPEHIGYRPTIGRYINAYAPLLYKPTPGGTWENIKKLLMHIFEEHYEYGLDYVELLYTKPTQKLPVLLLVSKENNTGKSTFCRFVREVFGSNATQLTNDILRNQFTSTWMSKLVVYIEETLFDKREDGEKIKNLVTSDHGQSEGKGENRVEVPLYAKFIMCSNDDERPVTLSPEDTRFWVRYVHPLPPDSPSSDFFEEIKKEIPAFLYYLMSRPLSTKNEDRLWFRRALIETEAWRKIVQCSRPAIEKQIADVLLDVMDMCGADVLEYTRKDLYVLLRQYDVKIDSLTLLRVLKFRWKMAPKGKSERYTLWKVLPEQATPLSKTGSYYTFERRKLERLI